MNPLLEPEAAPERSPETMEGGLLLRRLEDGILAGQDMAGTLERADLWKRLDPEDRLRWAELAQMAGCRDTALTVLESVHQDAPQNRAAWERHLELLTILGRRKALAALTARAKTHIDLPKPDFRPPVARDPNAGEADVEASLAPFQKRTQRMAALKRFLDLFAGRRDCFARQWVDRETGRQGYVPVRQQLGPSDLEDHLRGRRTYGIYLLQEDGRIRTAVVDADIKKDLRVGPRSRSQKQTIRREAAYLVSRVRTLCAEAGCPPLVEFSGAKGYHFWFFFPTPTDPAPVRGALGRLVAKIAPDLSVFGLEVFPKQERLGGKGLGNLVKLPLGVHRLNGRRSYFIGCGDRTVDAQQAFLATAVCTDPERLIRAFSAPLAEVVALPKPGTTKVPDWGGDSPLTLLARRCSPLGAVIQRCTRGMEITLREEKLLYQSVGFLDDGRRLLHTLLSGHPEYNPHQVDYRLSRLRGTPLGCRRIHNLTGYQGPFCRFHRQDKYAHPLLHLQDWPVPAQPIAQKHADLTAALGSLKTAMLQVERLLAE